MSRYARKESGRQGAGRDALVRHSVWAITPRSFSAGTNSIDKDGFRLSIAWSQSATQAMGPLMSQWNLIEKLLDDLIEKGMTNDPEVRRVFGPLGLVAPDGRINVLVLDRQKTQALSEAAIDLSAKSADLVAKRLDLPTLRKELGVRSDEAALVIAYHEYMWELLAALETQGLVARPAIFANPQEAKVAGAAALVFAVKQVD